MAILKCGYCGGNLDLNENMTVGICQFCGSTNIIPKNLEKKQNLYNKATYLRQNSEFDKAIETYDKLLDEDNTDADAHWGITLCKYGIDYVTDPHSGEKIPTCHRVQTQLILNDLDYKAAIQYAKDIWARELYEKEAKKIAEIQRKYWDIAKKESKYDIFICYKETDDISGERTLDSALAQDIYFELEKLGYRVFFARKTLEGKLGTEFEPIIFAALNSAQVMIVVGTKPEYFTAPWVRNEWSRYLQFVRAGDKNIIPTYRNISPYELPDELAVYQALDMSKIGFLQDLLDGIKKLTNRKTDSFQNVTGGVNINALLSRGRMEIEDRQWNNANKFFEQVLNLDAENAEAYLGLVLADQKSTSVEDIGKVHLQGTSNAKVQTLTVPIKDENTIAEVVKKYSIDECYERIEIEKSFDYDLSYDSAVADRERQLQNEMDFWKNNKFLKKVYRFGDEKIKKTLDSVSKKTLEIMNRRIDYAKEQDEKNITRIVEEYQTHIENARQIVVNNYVQKKYDGVMKEYHKLNKNNVEKVIGDLTEIKDLYDNMEFLSEPSYMKLNEKLMRCLRKAKAWKRKPFIISIVILLLILLCVIYLNMQYGKAVNMISKGEYEKANEILDGIRFYKDAASLVDNNKEEIAYLEANELLAAGDYNGAAEIIYDMQYYKDCDALVTQYGLKVLAIS